MWDPLVEWTGPRVVPTEFRIFRAGENETEQGTFLFDDEAAASVMEGWGERGIDLTMDYEHQSTVKPPVESPNSATRWVPQIRNGELWATEVKWTDKAYAYLASGEYRYFSPAFTYDTESRRVTRIINVALTNNPAMRAISPLVAASARGTGAAMDELKAEIEKLKAALEEKDAKIKELETKLEEKAATKDDGGGDGEAAESVMAALSLRSGSTAEKVAKATALVTLRSNVLALTGATSDAAAVGTINAWKAAQEKVATLSAQVATMEAEKHAAAFNALIEQATTAGKLPPARKDELVATLTRTTGGKVTGETVQAATTFLSLLTPAVSTTGAAQPPTTGAAKHPTELLIEKVCGPVKAVQAASARG